MTRLRIQTDLLSENRVKGRLKTPPVIPPCLTRKN